MKFISSRGGSREYTFEEAALHGLGEDGGLLLPKTLPQIDKIEQKRWSELSFQDLCTELLALFLNSEDEKSAERQPLRDVLPSLVRRSFSRFRLPEIVKIKQLVPTTAKRMNGHKNEESHTGQGGKIEHRCQTAATATTESARVRVTKTDISQEQMPRKEEERDEEEQMPARASREELRDAEGRGRETPGQQCDQRDDIFLLELFHGPTFAFKDIALQFLGELLSYLQQKEKKTYVVLGATSGDTGSAAIAALKNRSPGLHTVILFPKGRVSSIQKLQMVTTKDPRVHCLQVDGTFDDCQEMLKDVLNEYQSRKRLQSLETVDTRQDITTSQRSKAGLAGRLCVVNSINCTRILVQAAYWWYAALQLEKHLQVVKQGKSKKSVYWPPSYPTFVVPTGNFGNVFSCLFAKLMGAPIGKLLMTTNSNDVLVQAYNHGIYQKRGSVNQTCSPSMDIATASNFERLLLLEKLLRAEHKQQHCPPAEKAVQRHIPQSCSSEQEIQRMDFSAKDWLGTDSLPETAAPAATPPIAAVVGKGVSKIQTSNVEGTGTAKGADGKISSDLTKEESKESVSATHETSGNNVVGSSKVVATPAIIEAPENPPEETCSNLQRSETTSAVAEKPDRRRLPAQTNMVKLSADALQFFRKYFLAVSVDDDETKVAIRDMFMTYNEIIDPHTAVGYAAYLKKNTRSLQTLTSTASGKQVAADAKLCSSLEMGIKENEGERYRGNVPSDGFPPVQGPANTMFLPHELKHKETTRLDSQCHCERSLVSPCSTYLLACTAHFAKFPETVLPQVGLGQEKFVPQELRDLHLLQQHFQDIPPCSGLLSDYVEKIFTRVAEDC